MFGEESGVVIALFELCQINGFVADNPMESVDVAAIGGIESALRIDDGPSAVAKTDEPAKFLAGGCIPQPRRLVRTPRQDPPPIRRKCDRINGAGMPLKRADLLAGRRFPKPR